MNLTILALYIIGFAWTISALPVQESTENSSDSLSNSTTLNESESIKDKNDNDNMEINSFVKEDDISTTMTSNITNSETQEPSLENADESIVGEATARLSEALLTGYAESTSNIVLSPLGYSTLLALVAEGAKDETRLQLLSALGIQDLQPESTRQAFRSVLNRLKGQHSPNQNPEFKNWFYVSNKYPVNEDYIRILREYYNTEVKIIKDWLSWDDDSKAQSLNTMIKNKNDSTKDESTKENYKTKTALDQIILEEFSTQIKQVNDNTNINLKEKTPDKNEKTKYPSEKINENKDEDDKKIVDFSDQNKNENEKNPLLDLMVHHSLREKNNRNSKALLDQTKGGGTEILGSKFSSKDSLGSMMLAFNGLYFKGRWPTKSVTVLQETLPFKAGLNGSKVVDARMLTFSPVKNIDIYARCSYLEELQSRAYEIPFRDGRYVLLLVVPDREDGLPTLIHRLQKEGLHKIKYSLKPSQKSIIFPSFEIETTTQPRKSFNSLGLSHLFNQSKADLSGISSEPGLYVHDLAQFVAVKIDAKISSVNLITAEGFAVGRAEEFKEPEKEVVDRPFAFYILDRNNGVVIVAGRIIDPTELQPLFNIPQANSFN